MGMSLSSNSSVEASPLRAVETAESSKRHMMKNAETDSRDFVRGFPLEEIFVNFFHQLV
jgi:hypothetical protein